MQQCGSEGVFISTVNNVDLGMYHFTQQAGCGREVLFISTVNSVEVRLYLCLQVWTRGCVHFPYLKCWSEGVSVSTVNNVNVRVYPVPPQAVWMLGCVPFHSQQYGHEGACIPVYNQQCGRGVFPFPPLIL
jgi:hypothetical protein